MKHSLIILSSILFACSEDSKEDRIEGTEPGDCTDGADNDADGIFDCDDDGCASSPDCTNDQDQSNVDTDTTTDTTTETTTETDTTTETNTETTTETTTETNTETTTETDTTTETSTNSDVEQRIIGYYPEWGVYERDYQVWDIPAEKMTHINYGFISPVKELCTDGIDNDLNDGYLNPLVDCADPDCASHAACGGTLQDDDIPYVCQVFDAWAAIDMPNNDPNGDGAGWPNGTFAQLNHLKGQHPHLKTMISIGGWTLSDQFSDMAKTASSRETFVASCVQIMLDYGFDGIDVDWEYPVSGGLTDGAPEDKENFTLLLAEFRSQLDALGGDYPLTIASPAGPQTIPNLDLAAIAPYLDWINLMAYDFHGSWSDTTDFQNALYAKQGTAIAEANVNTAVETYISSGVPAEKMVIGVPFYGRGWGGVSNTNNGLFQNFSQIPMGTWEAGVFDYHDIVNNYLNQGDYTRHWDADAMVPWVYSPTEGIMISYDDPESLQVKIDYIKANGLGGAMFWDLSGDTSDNELLDVLYQGLFTE